MEFENFTDHIQELIFQQTSAYLTDVLGTEDWSEELHGAHGLLMYNVVKAISKKMNII